MSSPLSSLSLEMATFANQAQATRSQDTLPMYTSDVLPAYSPHAPDTLQEQGQQAHNESVVPAASAVPPANNDNGQPPLSHRATVTTFLFRSRKEIAITLVVLTFIAVGIYVGNKQKSQATQV
ncbi:hypothetical protein EYR40_007695 [Pleurotus pulmonarius]|nr:hypothetical protein EYR36_008551 [Pleurotus pulmonarius]KAF4596617.1 hypothetical protein EYR38_008004 [Pleurotus pulmonarius]KAF4597243.1 hypothetical protein EYR40_007695 [Pleurotus pulmonarius]